MPRASPTSGRGANDILLSVGSMNSQGVKALFFPSARYSGLWFLFMAYINDAVRNSNLRASKLLDKSEQRFREDVERSSRTSRVQIFS